MLENIRYKYIKNKNKQCVLFLHGWGGNENSFYNTIELLKNDYSILAINLTDINTNYLNKPLTMYDYAICVYLILNTLKIDSVHIVCHSFGFRVALILNKLFKLKINSFVVIDGAGVNFFSFIKNLKILRFKFAKFLVKIKLKKQSYLKKFGSDDYKDLNDNLKQTFKNIVNYNLKNYVFDIKCKTTIIWGKKDKVTKLKVAKFLHKNIKNSVLKIYNAGHFSYVDCPFDFSFDVLSHFNLV